MIEVPGTCLDFTVGTSMLTLVENVSAKCVCTYQRLTLVMNKVQDVVIVDHFKHVLFSAWYFQMSIFNRAPKEYLGRKV